MGHLDGPVVGHVLWLKYDLEVLGSSPTLGSPHRAFFSSACVSTSLWVCHEEINRFFFFNIEVMQREAKELPTLLDVELILPKS